MKSLFTRPLLMKCIGVSLGIHILGLYLWIQHPIFLKQYLPFLFTSKESEPKPIDSPTAVTDVTLEEFFQDFFPLSSDIAAEKKPIILQNLFPSTQTTEQKELEDIFLQLASHASLAEKKLNLPSSLEQTSFLSWPSPATSIQPKECLEPLHAPKALPESALVHSFPPIEFGSPPPLEKDSLPLALSYFPRAENNVSFSFGSLQTHTLSFLDECVDFSMEENLEPLFSVTFSSLFKEPKLSSLSNVVRQNSLSLLAEAAFSDIDAYLSSGTLYNMEWNDSFAVSPSFFADEEGYIFSLSISPDESLSKAAVKQNIYFLVDVSSEIENSKITVFKRSVLKALSALQAGDYFNILLLDKKICAFSPHSVPFSFHNLSLAEEFLEKKRDRAIFSSFDLFQGLDNVIEGIESNEEMHTAILLTNGKFSSSYLRKHLGHFLEKNDGKLCLFTAGVGKNNDLVHLDMISSLAGGKLLYSDTNTSFPRKLTNFVKGLHGPLARDVHLCVRTSDPKAEVVLLPRSSQPSYLYSKEPFIIMGKTNRLCPLEVTLEGKNEEGWILIQKETGFAAAEEASIQTKKEWALRQVSSCYEQFLQEGEEEYLDKAKTLLKMAHGRKLGE